MSNIFEIASRKKYRFPFKGSISTEDLWDLSEVQLDSVYKALSREAQKAGEDSLLSDRELDPDLMNRIEIVKHIFAAKKAEAEQSKAEHEKAIKRRRILEVIAQKQDENLRNMSEADLQKMLDELS